MIKINTNNGVTFFKTITDEFKTGTGNICVGDLRSIVKGRAQMILTQGSVKFNDEIQFALLMSKGNWKIEKRNLSNWDTLEICVPVKTGLRMFKDFFKILESKKLISITELINYSPQGQL